MPERTTKSDMTTSQSDTASNMKVIDWAAQLRKTSSTDYAEAFSWLTCSILMFTWYNAVGEIASQRGVDWAPVVDGATYNFDRSLPVIPHFVLPYMMVYLMPAAFLIQTIRYKGLDMGMVRKFYSVQMAMILIAFACYMAFPLRFDIITNRETGEIDVDISSTWLHRLNYQFIHQGISMWVSCPSMHNAHAWAIALAFREHRLPGWKAAIALAIITAPATIFTKAHGPPHVKAGIVLAFLVHFMVYNKINLQGQVNNKVRLALAVAVPIAFHFIGMYLAKVSGWEVDVPAMFGLNHRIPGGFRLGVYGF